MLACSSLAALLTALFLSPAGVVQTAAARPTVSLKPLRSDDEFPRPDTKLPFPIGHDRMDKDGFYGGGKFILFRENKQTEFTCPYLQEQAKKNSGPEKSAKRVECTHLDNLEKLRWAQTAYELAEFLRWTQQWWLTDWCYELAGRLCPGSRIDDLAAERLRQYSTDPNRRMLELINQSKDLREIELEWTRLWFTDHPSQLTAEKLPTAPSGPAASKSSEEKQVRLHITIADVPCGRFFKGASHVKILAPAEREKLEHRLQHLRDAGKTKLVAEPQLTTLSGRQASFLDGGEVAVSKTESNGQIGVQFEEFGTRIRLKPTVLENGKIQVEVEPEISKLDPALGTTIEGVIAAGRTTHRIHLSVEMRAGNTVAVGGLPGTAGDDATTKDRETIVLVTAEVAEKEAKKVLEIEKQLRSPISVNFVEVPLKKILEDIQSWHGVKIALDPVAIDEALISLDTPITMELEDVSLKTALDLILGHAQLMYIIRKNELLVKPRPLNLHGSVEVEEPELLPLPAEANDNQSRAPSLSPSEDTMRPFLLPDHDIVRAVYTLYLERVESEQPQLILKVIESSSQKPQRK
jgi:hypothetical protein